MLFVFFLSEAINAIVFIIMEQISETRCNDFRNQKCAFATQLKNKLFK